MANKDMKGKVYAFILSFTAEKGYPPSVREIASAVNLKSTSSVHNQLQKLEKDGLIKRDPTKPRALEIPELNNKPEMIHIPIVGKVTAGVPILAVENIEDYFHLPMNFVKHDNELYMLKVSGNSMIEAGINNGDLAIVEKVNAAKNGDIVVAMIDSEATIKRFFKEKDHIRLQPENSSMQPILVPTCDILGKLVGIYRKI